jgi:alpha-mannosidase
MKFEQLVFLLPCYSLESFDFQQTEEDAEQLLSGWSALWHPRLLADAQALPKWMPAESPPQDATGHLVIVPNCCEPLLPEDWVSQAEAVGASVLRKIRQRDAIVAAALERCEPSSASLDAELVADFLALGYCHFQIELMTRKLRYMSNLDESGLRTAALAAAEETLKGNGSAAREHLQKAFDRLHDAREYFYPTAAKLVDLTLVAPTTLGEPLRNELAGQQPSNLVIAGEVVEKIVAADSALLDTLRTALNEHRASLIGGEPSEAPLPLMTADAIALHLRQGIACYEKHLGQRPKIFGRRRFGLTPTLPAILNKTGFTGVVHFTLDDGQFPTNNQSRIQWEGVDGASIEAVGCLPLDAARSDVFVRLAETLSNATNLDQTGTVLFAHWPGRVSPWYEDLRRIAAYGSILGKFYTIEDYFEQTLYSGYRNNYAPDKYRAPYLTQDVAAGRSDPIARWKRYYSRLQLLEAASSLDTLATLSGQKTTEHPKHDELATTIQKALAGEESDPLFQSLDDELAIALEDSLVRFVDAAFRGTTSTARGELAINANSFPLHAKVYPSDGSPRAMAFDVPAMGFAWADRDVEPSTVVERKGFLGRKIVEPLPPLAEDYVLRNEFFHAYFDPHTGAIRAISDYESRNPRVAQQIAMRLPQGGDPSSDLNYSIMAADEWQVTSTGPVLGEIVCRGRLMDREGHRLAGFQQTTRIWRGSRVLEIAIDLDIDKQPGANPWDSYYAVRFAWKNEAMTLRRGLPLVNAATELTQFESPFFVDLAEPKRHTTLLTAGLPYHRRFGKRRLDTLLAVRGDSCRSFRLGIGVEVPNPTAAALGFLVPPLVIANRPAPSATSGWLFHLDSRNVVATHWEPVFDGDSDKVKGFRVCLLETEGRSCRLGLRCFRKPKAAYQAVPDETTPMELVVEDDCIQIPITGHEQLEIEGQF